MLTAPVPRSARARPWTVAVAFALVLVTVGSGLVVVVSQSAGAAAPPAPAASVAVPRNALPLNTPLRLNATENAAVRAQLAAAVASGNAIEVAGARAASAVVPNLTAEQLFDSTPLANVTPTLDEALSLIPSGAVAPSYEFASLGDYLEAAGVGCLTSGVLTSVAGSALGTVTTIATETEAGVTTTVTKTSVPTFILSCAVGAAVGLVTFQMGFLQAHQAVDFAGLYHEFAGGELAAFANYENLTQAMYATLISALHFSQVGLDRIADNAALLQLGNVTFNTADDLLSSGLAAMLLNVPTDYEYQVASNFLNLPLWMSALAGPGGYYNGYSYTGLASFATSSSESPADTLTAISDLYNNVTPPVHAVDESEYGAQTTGGLAFDVCSTAAVDDVLWGGTVLSPVWDVAFAEGSTAAFPWTVTFTAADKSHEPTATLTLSSISPVDHQAILNLSRGLYNVTASMACTVGGAPEGVYLILPFSGLLPTSSSVTLGTFGWVDRYYTESASRSGCGGSFTSQSDEHVIASSLAGSDIPSARGTVFTVSGWLGFGLSSSCSDGSYSGGHYTTYASVTPEAQGAFPGTTPSTMSPSESTISAQIAGMANNATLSAQTYWTYIRTLGYHSISSLPPDCVIPAPYSAMPTDSNLGTLTLNQSMALYLAYLQSLGTFYGSSSTFSVCSGPVKTGYNWLNATFGDVAVTATGLVYLNNGVHPIWASGVENHAETWDSASTWSIRGACTDPSGCTDTFSSYPAELILAPTVRAIGVPVAQKWEIADNNPVWVYYTNASSNQTLTGGYLAELSGNGTKNSGPQTVGSSTPGDALYLDSCSHNGKSVTECNVTVGNLSVYFAQIACGGSCVVESPVTGGAGSSGPCGSGIWGDIVGFFAGFFGGCSGLGTIIGEVIALVVIVAVIGVVVFAGVRGASGRKSRQ